MANRKFYWLKLQKDFFKRHDVKIIEAMENGKDYLLFYLKLLCESVDHEGNLRFSETIPYDDKMLATITGTNVDIVRSAIKVFTGLNMIDILDDKTIFMTEVTKMIGCEGASAERVRKHRALQCNTLVTNCNIEIEKEIDIELDKELDIEKEKEINNNNNIISPPHDGCMKTPTYEEVKSYFDEHGLNDFEGFYQKNEMEGWKWKKGWRGWAVLWSKDHS
jgi:predicted phage replisome organizer